MMRFVGNQIVVETPKKPKKITGTHFAEVLGLNPYCTPFEAWCRCVRLYEEPFVGNKYTEAGKIIEPKVFDFLRDSYGFGKSLVVPTDIYGVDPFRATYGDFYKDTQIFGGMWDAKVIDENGKDKSIVEVKTVFVEGHSGDIADRWPDGKAPDYQALQASLYGILSNVDEVYMVGITLGNNDYERPDLVVPSFANGNVIIDHFLISERYPNIEELIDSATDFWFSYVRTGISPIYDDKKDAKILRELRNNFVTTDGNIDSVMSEADILRDELDDVKEKYSEKEKRLKKLEDIIKDYAANQFRDGDKSVTVVGKKYRYILTRSTSEKFDEDAFAKDNPTEYALYSKPTESLRFTKTKNKE